MPDKPNRSTPAQSVVRSAFPRALASASLRAARASGLPMPARLAHSSGPWALNHAKPFTAARSGRRRNALPLPARKPTSLHAKRGTSACSAIAVRRNHRRRSETPSTLDFFISKSAALAATRIRPWRSTSCDGQSPRRSMNLSVTCGVGTAQRFGAIPTSAAMWSRCGRRRYLRAIRRRRGGRGSGNARLHYKRKSQNKCRGNRLGGHGRMDCRAG